MQRKSPESFVPLKSNWFQILVTLADGEQHGYAIMMRQFTQTCACNQFHTIDARLCRWLVAIAERSQSKRLDLTQEFLARILGVQRTSIGPAATELREAGITRYSRGVIEILDEERLKARACECYSIVDAEQKELLSEQSHIRAA